MAESRDVAAAAKTKREKGKAERAQAALDEEERNAKEKAQDAADAEAAHLAAMKANNERGAKLKEENDRKKEAAFYKKEAEDRQAI